MPVKTGDWFARRPIRFKLLFSFSITLILVLIFVTAILVLNFTQRNMEMSKIYLEKFTEQVIVNFRQNQRTTEMQLFNISNMFDIPQTMYEVSASQDMETVRDLYTKIRMIVSNLFPFNTVLIRTLDGTYISSAFTQDGQRTAERMTVLLDDVRENLVDDGILWIRDSDGTVYLARMVLTISPLRYVGEMIAKISEDKLFKLNEDKKYLNYTFLFFDEHGKNVIVAGSIDEELRIRIIEDYNNGIFNSETSQWNRSDYFLSIKKNGEWTAVGILPLEGLYRERMILILVCVVIGAIALVLGTLAVYAVTQRLTRQLKLLTNSMNKVAGGDFKQMIPVLTQDDFGQLAIHFNQMINEISELLKQVVQEVKQKSEIQLQLLDYRCRSLQNQINPHFIYNALETINAMAKICGNVEIGTVVRLISRYFRHTTLSMGTQFIVLEREIANLKDYVEIYRYIYGDKLVCDFVLPEFLGAALVPTMILQPILENALVHGRRFSEEISAVSVSVSQTGNKEEVLIAIQDNGYGMPGGSADELFEVPGRQGKSYEHTGIGIANVAERLKLLYGDKAEITASSSSSGTLASIRIPLFF